jgi:ParB family chromosome partitioning protein
VTFNHSSDSVEFYTPPAIVEAARATMGGIDLDPASCAEANEVVRATVHLGLPENALRLGWSHYGDRAALVFLNPPGGKIGKRSSAVVWWEKLVDEWLDGNVEQAIYICFNLEVLNTTQQSPSPCLDFPICYFRSRPRFWPPGTPPELRGKSGSPKYPGCAVYLPPQIAVGLPESAEVQRFASAFAPLGRVVVPS